MNFRRDLGEKLVVILQKLTDSNLKLADDVFLEKLLTAVRNELAKSSDKIGNLDEVIKWFNSNIEQWVDNPPSVNVLAFVIQLLGIVSGIEEIFNKIHVPLLETQVYNLKPQILKTINLKFKYINLLWNIVSHKSGCEWVVKAKLWREVVDLYMSTSGLFIQREGISFLTKLLQNTNWDHILFKEITDMIFKPLESYKNEFQQQTMNERNFYYKKLETVAISVFQAYIGIIETWAVSSNDMSNVLTVKSADTDLFWKFILERNENDTLLEKVAVAYTLQTLCKNYDLESLIQRREMPDSIFEVFKILIKRKKISVVIKFAKYFQLFWSKITCNSSSGENGELESHFIIIQMIPLFLLVKKPKHENSMLEIFVNKLFDITNENTVRVGYLLRDVIKYDENEDTTQYAFMAVLSVSKNMETLTLNRAVLIFQSLAYVLKIFTPRCCNLDDPITDEEFQRDLLLCRTKEGLLSAILSALCALIEKFKINWTEALESLCLLKFSSTLLSNPNLSPRLGVQTLSLVKLVILNFMAPDLVLLSDKVEGTNLECVLRKVYNKLHDPNWEIRDSSVEVIGIIAELADTKFPAFQEILLNGNYYELILSMSECDGESYVRSSALRALSQMVRIESIRNRYLNNVDLISRISDIIRNESEGIVRREAALLAKELFDSQICRSESLMNLFHTMGYAAINDLHWEVKVNALFFWEKVIQRLIADQGMIDGSFPSITFSKENKKIVSLTEMEIKSRLNKVLTELSNIGCLHILLTTLKDDYDFQVVQKSAQILTDLLEILKRYEMLDKHVPCQKSDKCCMKRKSSRDESPEKKISHTFPDHLVEENEVAKSNRIIEEIVNERDVSLLENVYNPNKVAHSSEIDVFYLKKVEPELFLKKIQNLDINTFLNTKRKWLISQEDDLNELMNDILTLSVEHETNVLDCY